VSPLVSRELLEARIDREREALIEALDDVRERTRAELDVARRVRERPLAWLVGASLVGLWLGARR
jgi:hypothetical protein